MQLTLGLRVCFTATATPSLRGAGRLYSISFLLSIHGSVLLTIVFVRSVFSEAVWMSVLLHSIIHLDNSQSFLQYGLHLRCVNLLNRDTQVRAQVVITRRENWKGRVNSQWKALSSLTFPQGFWAGPEYRWAGTPAVTWAFPLHNPRQRKKKCC